MLGTEISMDLKTMSNFVYVRNSNKYGSEKDVLLALEVLDGQHKNLKCEYRCCDRKKATVANVFS